MSSANQHIANVQGDLKMETKRVSRLMRPIIVGAIVLGSAANVSAEQTSRSGIRPPTAASMEQHWQSVIHEREPARRQALIAEHRRMMDEAQKTDKDKGIPPKGNETNAMTQDSGHPGLRNTIEMHSIMLDMMK